jgi:PhnB protein
MFLLPPPLQFKTGENAPGAVGIQEWFASFEGPIHLCYQELTITAGDAVAFCHCLEHLSGKRTDGSTTDVWYRETLGLRKIDGDWKITHQHQSFPTYMDGSLKAATDLQP